MSGSLLGNEVLRREDPDLLRGAGTFVANRPIEGAVAVAFVRSQVAFADLVGVDVADALELPGVLAVVTAADLEITHTANALPFLPEPTRHPLLAIDRLRYVGQPVAAVVAETEAQAADAVDAVLVDFEPLPPVVDPFEALSGERLLYDDTDSNVVFALPGDPVDFSGCEVVIEQRIVNQRLAAVPIEPRVGACAWEGDRLHYWASTQGAHPMRDTIAELYGLDPSLVHVVSADVGGGFGAKGSPHPEELLLPELARRVGRPVRWLETRTENLQAMSHGRGQYQTVTLGGSRDGRITHYQLDIVQDGGAHPRYGVVLPAGTNMMGAGCYDLVEARVTATSVVTNTAPVGAYRGAGRPEAAAAIERAVDCFADEIGMDPVEVRRRNLVGPDRFPFTTRTGATYDSGDYPAALEKAVAAAGYDELRAEQATRRERGDRWQLGIGVASYVEVTAIGAGGEFGDVELRPDGTVLVRTGSNPYGQGHHTTWAMIVADRLGVPLEAVTVVHGDTDLVPEGSVTGGSRSVQLAGSAVHDACLKLVDAARQRAADLLEAAPDDIVLDTDAGTFAVAGTPARSVGWTDLAASDGPALTGASDFTQEASSFPFGAHVSVVEVDVETGRTRVLRHIAVDDAGTLVNPMIVAGQVHGGAAQGIAQALLEEVVYDDEGNLVTSNLADYSAISAAELPLFERVPMETPSPLNPLGAKGIGESGTIGATPAVHNAIVDAVSHLGVRHIDMPCTPERVWRAVS